MANVLKPNCDLILPITVRYRLGSSARLAAQWVGWARAPAPPLHPTLGGPHTLLYNARQAKQSPHTPSKPTVALFAAYAFAPPTDRSKRWAAENGGRGANRMTAVLKILKGRQRPNRTKAAVQHSVISHPTSVGLAVFSNRDYTGKACRQFTIIKHRISAFNLSNLWKTAVDLLAGSKVRPSIQYAA